MSAWSWRRSMPRWRRTIHSGCCATNGPTRAAAGARGRRSAVAGRARGALSAAVRMPRERRLLRRDGLLITCEHGGNRIPPRYRAAFAGAARALASHQGYDPGALALAREFARRLAAPVVYSTTRLLLN